MRQKSLLVVVCLVAALVALPSAGQALERARDLTAQNTRVYNGFGSALTPATTEAPGQVVRSFMESRHADRTFGTLRVEREFSAPNAAGVTHLRMSQEMEGLTVFGTYVRAAVNEFGEMTWLAENVVTPPRTGLVPARIGAEQALVTALRRLHPGLGDFTQVRVQGNTTEFAGDSSFFRAPHVTRVAIPMADGAIHVGYLVETWTDKDNLLHHTLVSGSGRILGVQLRTNTDSYNVFADHPGVSNQAVVAGPGAGNAQSPIGWLDAGSHLSISISGNNAEAYLDAGNSDSADPTRPDGSAGATISDGNFVAVASLGNEPEDGLNPDVAVQNLFYLCNVVHDKLYQHGFVESASNFQNNNFGNGGNGGDPVLCEAQDGSGTNNANFSTPTDGSSGRMQMYVWTQTSPKRDGDLDSDIVWHEYGHGLTWRMIGSMSGPMSGAIGEGMGDTLAVLINSEDRVGEYSTDDPNGIRSAPYTNYSRTYGDFGGSSVHFDGEIYAAIQWDLKNRYASNGFDVEDHLDDVVGGMNFTAAGPSFEDMRDGILAQAPSSRDCLVWESFAAFGVGVNASGSVQGGGPFGGGKIRVTEDFNVPASCSGCVPSEPTEVSCSDGQDNDCDGLVDGDDPDCGGGMCTDAGESCGNDGDCCSGNCSNGPPSSRVCIG